MKYKEALDKTIEKQLVKFLKKYNRWANSRQVQRTINRKWREYDKKPDLEKENYVKQLLLDIKLRKEILEQDITEQYKNEGKNVNHAGVWKSIQFQVNKQLTAHYGFNPDNLEDVSIQTAKQLLFPNFEKLVDPIDKDNFIFDKVDSELDAIERLAKHDAKAWVGTMMRLEMYKQAKRNGRLGMWIDQKGKFQI